MSDLSLLDKISLRNEYVNKINIKIKKSIKFLEKIDQSLKNNYNQSGGRNIISDRMTPYIYDFEKIEIDKSFKNKYSQNAGTPGSETIQPRPESILFPNGNKYDLTPSMDPFFRKLDGPAISDLQIIDITEESVSALVTSTQSDIKKMHEVSTFLNELMKKKITKKINDLESDIANLRAQLTQVQATAASTGTEQTAVIMNLNTRIAELETALLLCGTTFRSALTDVNASVFASGL